MKKALLTLFLLTAVFSGFAQMQPAKDSVYYKNHFYLNPFDLFFKTFTVTYEYDIRPAQNSVAFSAGVILSKTNSVSENGFNGEFQYRINVFDYKVSKRGFVNHIFFAPYLQFRYLDHKEAGYDDTQILTYPPKTYVYESRNANLRGYGGGVVMGIKSYAFNNRFCFGLYGGGGVKYTEVKGNQNVFDTNLIGEDYTGITPKFGLQMGMSF